MQHLLLNTSLFIPLQNDTFAQLIGRPITSIQPHTPDIFFNDSGPSDTILAKRPSEEQTRSSKRRKLDEGVAPASETFALQKPKLDTKCVSDTIQHCN